MSYNPNKPKISYSKVLAYNKVDDCSHCNNTKSSKARIRKESTKDGQQIGQGVPQEHYNSSSCRVKMILLKQVQNHVYTEPHYCNLFKGLVCYRKMEITTWLY